MKGLFITFEGGEGSGKTSIIREVVSYLEKKNYGVISTREPGGSDIAEQIRNVILNVKNTNMTIETETLLYAASRVQHLKEKVLPALDEGKVIICDRYVDSSLAYQGYARGVGMENVLIANHFAMEHMPDITFFIDVTPEVGLKRISSRVSKLDRLDLEAEDFHNRVYKGYFEVMKMYPNRIVRINGNQSLDKVIKEVEVKLDEFLNK